ncbi:MAG: SpoVG family protein [Fibrobacter sp.]|nr:SpoVG family protein [Fibrobacter sp.]
MANENEKAADKTAASAEQKASQFECLAVTNVQVFPFKEGPNLGHMKGLATVVLNDQMLIRGLRVMDGENGLFVGYPNDPFYKGEDFRSICNPITRQLREHIENCVLEKYQASVA